MTAHASPAGLTSEDRRSRARDVRATDASDVKDSGLSRCWRFGYLHL